jgi:hypothetical protein
MSNMWQEAFASACPQWAVSVRHAGWHHVLMAAGYAIASWLCVVSALMTRRADGDGGAWFAAAALLALLGINALLQFDLLLVQVLRAVARLQGWYQSRREWQFALLGLLSTGGLVALGWLRTRLHARWSDCSPAVLGLALLVALAAVKAVSFHDTDAALGLRLAGVSLGRLAELAGLVLTVAGALRWLRAVQPGHRIEER